MLTDITKRLELHHNIVLHGAPGTGKTFLAKKIAKLMNATEEQLKEVEDLNDDGIEKLLKIIDSDPDSKDCYKLVQFHPSYDYTDFVEGLRSYEVTGEDGKTSIGFRREDGVFKEFCKRAINDKNHNYVFIIDEINRGNMSKIFGELFFSIDPGYRGIEGRVDTQYQNLINDDDVFKHGFFVPENVYIIGTMNDIDRSVECMDFAFRRRFVFEEIKAFEGDRNDDNIKKHWLTKELNDNGTAIKVMNALNDAIFCDDKEKIKVKGLNSGYHIGPAYFEKLDKFRSKDDKDTDGKGKIDKPSYKQLWKYCLEPLLREYVRGNAKPDEDLKALESVYKQAMEDYVAPGNDKLKPAQPNEGLTDAGGNNSSNDVTPATDD